MHYHWNRNLFYHEMLLAIQADPEKDNRFYSDLIDKPTDYAKNTASTKACNDHSIVASDKAT